MKTLFMIVVLLSLNTFANVKLPTYDSRAFCSTPRLNSFLAGNELYFSRHCEAAFLFPPNKLKLKLVKSSLNAVCSGVDKNDNNEPVKVDIEISNSVNTLVHQIVGKEIDAYVTKSVEITPFMNSSFFYLDDPELTVDISSSSQHKGLKVDVDKWFFFVAEDSIKLSILVPSHKVCHLQQNKERAEDAIIIILKKLNFHRHFQVEFLSGLKNFSIFL